LKKEKLSPKELKETIFFYAINIIFLCSKYNFLDNQIIRKRRMLTSALRAMVKYLKQISFYEKVVY